MSDLTLGSLFAGIGGFDLGFERAGWKTIWQIEIDPRNRAVLADRFPDAQRFADVLNVGAETLPPVACITAGFPCQDISVSGSRTGRGSGLAGERSGLFWQAIRVIREILPTWVVLENVLGLFSVNARADFEAVIRALADSGYLGFWRVLNAQYFGVPQNRRRVFMVAGFGRYPTFDVLADAAPMAALHTAYSAREKSWSEANAWAGHTLQAHTRLSQITLGCEPLVAEQGRWGAMVERARKSRVHGVPSGLDSAACYQKWAAGNAVPPQIAEWIALKLLESM